ncbi:MAG: flagellin [candidate division Zixibacteria bacterium]|nr:flagellin [candidate division Zixibacteria bacterium]
MSFGAVSRVGTNVAALNSLHTLNKVNNKVTMHQMRISTGRRINTAEDDPAGSTISVKLDTRARGLGQALNNVGEAKNVLGISEGGLNNIYDILLTMKEKTTLAASDTLGSSERGAIATQLTDFAAEINRIVAETTFNGTALLDSTYNATFQSGAETTDVLNVAVSQSHTASSLGVNSLTVNTSSAASTSLAAVNTAISTVSSTLQTVGSVVSWLSVKENTLGVAINNTKAALSRIRDADLAHEQLELTKFQILQQTALSSLAQANANPQSMLSLFR